MKHSLYSIFLVHKEYKIYKSFYNKPFICVKVLTTIKAYVCATIRKSKEIQRPLPLLFREFSLVLHLLELKVKTPEKTGSEHIHGRVSISTL